MNQNSIDSSLLSAALPCSVSCKPVVEKAATGLLFAILLLLSAFLIFLLHMGAYKGSNYRYYPSFSRRYFPELFYGLQPFFIWCRLSFPERMHHSFLQKIHCKGAGHKHSIVWLRLVTSLFFLPVIPINPIGALPVLAYFLHCFAGFEIH